MKKFKIFIIIAICVVFVTVFIIRAAYAPEQLDTEDITISGLTDGIGVRAGENISEIYVAVPDHFETDDLISVTSDGNVAFLKLEKSDTDNRLIKASVIGKGAGIAEVYIKTSDNKAVSDKYTVNVFTDDHTENSSAPSSDTDDEKLENCVYVTPSGRKYHLSRKCAGDTATATELEMAVIQGYLPCKNCAVKK